MIKPKDHLKAELRTNGLLMEVALIRPDEPANRKLAAHRIWRGTRDSLGWISSLLLISLAGCRTPLPDSPPMVAAGQCEACDACSPVLASSDELSLQSVANRGTSGTNPPSEAGQLVRLASLESDLPSDTIVPLSLDDAINLSLERNPDLAAVRAAEPVARAALHVAETYPWNPQFQTQVAPYSRDRNGDDGAIAQQHVLVQTFELGRQRRFREGAAAANWEQVDATIRQAELMNIAETTRLFFAAIYQRELRDMRQSMADLNEQLVGVIQRREKAGQASNADVELARLQAQASRRQQRLAATNYQTAVMRLWNQLNLDPITQWELVGQFGDWRWRSLDNVIGCGLEQASTGSLDGDSEGESSEITASIHQDNDPALRQLVVDRPDVMAARAAVATAMENLRLATAMRRPNLQIGPIWQRDEASTEFWGIQAQIDIPVVNTGVPLVDQRVAELRQQQITALQLEDRAVLEARAAIRRYQRARGLIKQSRGEYDRTIVDALKLFEDQFRAGQITLLEVLAARTALAQSWQSVLELFNEVTLAAADVTQATGLLPQQMLTDVEPEPVLFEEVPTP